MCKRNTGRTAGLCCRAPEYREYCIAGKYETLQTHFCTCADTPEVGINEMFRIHGTLVILTRTSPLVNPHRHHEPGTKNWSTPSPDDCRSVRRRTAVSERCVGSFVCVAHLWMLRAVRRRCLRTAASLASWTQVRPNCKHFVLCVSTK